MQEESTLMTGMVGEGVGQGDEGGGRDGSGGGGRLGINYLSRNTVISGKTELLSCKNV